MTQPPMPSVAGVNIREKTDIITQPTTQEQIVFWFVRSPVIHCQILQYVSAIKGHWDVHTTPQTCFISTA
jgi:hypothetical protein